jgi:hypothetical protein
LSIVVFANLARSHLGKIAHDIAALYNLELALLRAGTKEKESKN